MGRQFKSTWKVGPSGRAAGAQRLEGSGNLVWDGWFMVKSGVQ